MKFNRGIFASNAAPEKLESNLMKSWETLEEFFEKCKRRKLQWFIRDSNRFPTGYMRTLSNHGWLLQPLENIYRVSQTKVYNKVCVLFEGFVWGVKENCMSQQGR